MVSNCSKTAFPKSTSRHFFEGAIADIFHAVAARTDNMMMIFPARKFVVGMPMTKIDATHNSHAIQRRDRAIDSDGISCASCLNFCYQAPEAQRLSLAGKDFKHHTASR